MTDFARTDYETMHNDVERRLDLYVRFTPPEDRWWKVVDVEDATRTSEVRKPCHPRSA